MGGGTLGHSMRRIAGGTRHSANNRAPVPSVTLTPNAAPVATIRAMAANHTWITLDRDMSFSMMFTLSHSVDARESDLFWDGSGICEMTASVVSRSDAIDAAFCIAERTTLVGSITPACTRFS